MSLRGEQMGLFGRSVEGTVCSMEKSERQGGTIEEQVAIASGLNDTRRPSHCGLVPVKGRDCLSVCMQPGSYSPKRSM